jgi:ketosteroid isomerase-like protein
MPTETTPEGVVRGLFDAFTARDMDRVRSLMAPDIVWQQSAGMPGGGRWVGFDQIAENVFGRFRREWDEWAAVPEEFLESADGDDLAAGTVVVLGRYVGTPKATGRPVDATFAHVYRVRDGAVVRFDQHTDTRALAEGLGLIAPP